MRNGNPLILAVETSGRMGSVALAQGPKLLADKQFSGPMRHSAEVFPAIVGLLKHFGKKPNQIEQVHISIGPGSFTGLRIAVTLAKTMALANPAPICSGPEIDESPVRTGRLKAFFRYSADANRCGTKIVAVDTLDCIAANVVGFTAENVEAAERENVLRQNERLATILDAKRGQFFIAVYEKTQNTPAYDLRGQARPKTPLPTTCRGKQDASWKKILPDCLMTAEEFLDRFAGCPGAPGIALIGEGLVYYKDKFNNPAVRVLDEKFWNPSASNIHHLGWQKALLGQFADPLTLTPNYLRGPDAKVKQI